MNSAQAADIFQTHSRRYDNDIDTEHEIEVNIHTVLNMKLNTEIYNSYTHAVLL